jgi:hypothetical protein
MGRKTTHVVNSQIQEVSCRDDTYPYDKGEEEKEDIDHGLTCSDSEGARHTLLSAKLLLMTLWPFRKSEGRVS